MRDLNEIQCFVKAIEMKSLTAAAKALGLPKSSVSRKIKSLESRLGVTLIVRTTRALNLTDAGRQFFERSAIALKELNVAEDELDSARDAIEGTLRITGPVGFSTGPFNLLIASFLRDHPQVKIDLLLTERVVDLIGEGFDLAFRMGELDDSTLLARKLKAVEAQVVASPQYIKARGMPKTVADLDRHECIGFTPDGTVMKWNLRGPNGKKEFVPKGRLLANQPLTLKEAALHGLGLALIPTFLIGEEIADKSLVVVFKDWYAKGDAVHLVFPGQKFLSPKMRAFIDYTSKHLAL